MKKLLIAAALALVACAPTATRSQSTNQTRSYGAPRDLVYNTILQVIRNDPGVPASTNGPARAASGPWKIAADQRGASVDATTESALLDASGADTGKRESQRISVVALSLLSNTQVTIVSSPNATYLRDAIIAKLDATYPAG